MRELFGDLWDLHARGEWIGVTTNGTVRKDGCAVMGRGIAKQAATRFPSLPFEVGQYIVRYGNMPQRFSDYRIYTFPVKHQWWEWADINLISESMYEIRCLWNMYNSGRLFIPRPGCGNGGLRWKDVRKEIAPIVKDLPITVVNNEINHSWIPDLRAVR